jgi:hypothetical protein
MAVLGGGQERAYPWGTADPGTTNPYERSRTAPAITRPGDPCTGVATIAPVGTAALGGGPANGADYLSQSNPLPTIRNDVNPANRATYVGFRCARTP